MKQLLFDTFAQLDPRIQLQNPVLLVTYACAIFVTVTASSWFDVQIAVWIWLTLLFANFSTAMAEGRGKAQATFLKKTYQKTNAKVKTGASFETRPAAQLQKGDIVLCEAGDIIPADGEAIEGIATVDESAITGESAPVIRDAGGDRSGVTAGTRLLSDSLLIRVTSEQGHSFVDRMASLIESAQRKKTPTEAALTIVLTSLSFLFIVVVLALRSFIEIHPSFMAALIICLIPTTISALL